MSFHWATAYIQWRAFDRYYKFKRLPDNKRWYYYIWFCSGIQYEAGQQKGGNYACHACNIDSNCHKKYSYAFKCKYLSLKDRITKVLHTLSSRNRLRAHNQIHLYSELNLPDIIDELHERTNKTLGKPTSNTMMFLR